MVLTVVSTASVRHFGSDRMLTEVSATSHDMCQYRPFFLLILHRLGCSALSDLRLNSPLRQSPIQNYDCSLQSPVKCRNPSNCAFPQIDAAAILRTCEFKCTLSAGAAELVCHGVQNKASWPHIVRILHDTLSPQAICSLRQNIKDLIDNKAKE